ncbi:S1C family serine protease [Tropicimonas sediminicola]|nr:S1C family serine protease [Tropicimonas sediminicola]
MTPPEIYDTLSTSIVQVVSFGVDPHRVAARVRAGTGSGVVLGELYVITNYHVVHGSEMILVNYGSGVLSAEVFAMDPALDVAILELEDFMPYEYEFDLASYPDLKVGQMVHAIAFPLGLRQSMSSGIISALDIKIPLNTISWTTQYIQTDAAISPGSSGGGLFDSCGRLVGLITLRSNHPQAENIGYALPVNTVKDLVVELMDSGKVTRAWHGLYGQMMSPLLARMMPRTPPPPETGFLVETVEPGSAADVAGLRGGYFPVLWGNAEMVLGGDIILEVDGEAVTSLDLALDIVRSLEVGDSVSVTYWRDGEIHETVATLPERPAHPADLWPGPR